MDHQHHNHAHAKEGGSIFTVSNALTALAIGTVVVGAAVILAPHILPALGVGGEDLAEEAGTILHHAPTGIAGSINSVLGNVPLIGAELAKGGLFTAFTSATAGLGGIALSQFMEKKEDGSKGIKWSKVIRYGALATSALIALPTVLTALGTGIIYLSMLLDSSVPALTPTAVVGTVGSSIGSIGGEHQTALLGASGVAAALPHLLLCCTSMLPAALSFKLWKDDKKEAAQEADFAGRVGGSKRILPPDDPNRFVTEEEKTWVEAYNLAPMPVKQSMQGWLKSKGYTPDFHADGTVHLYQHKHTPEASRG
jgi:hypothetical protein